MQKNTRRGDVLGLLFDPHDHDGWRDSQYAEHSRSPCQDEFTCSLKQQQRKQQQHATERVGVELKEALDTGDEDEKEKLEELTAAFEQLTWWLEKVLGDKLKSTSKELKDIGVEGRAPNIRQVGEGSHQHQWMTGEVGSVYSVVS